MVRAWYMYVHVHTCTSSCMRCVQRIAKAIYLATDEWARLHVHMYYTTVCSYSTQCTHRLLRKVREWHLSLSLYKQKAFVTCSITEFEPLPIYPFHWTTDLQSTVHNTTSLGKDAIINVLIWENNDIRGFGYQQFMLITVVQITMMSWTTLQRSIIAT